MSDIYNTEIIERAYDLAEELTGTTPGYIVNKAIEDYEKTGDVEDLSHRITDVEGKLSIEHFYNSDILGNRDV